MSCPKSRQVVAEITEVLVTAGGHQRQGASVEYPFGRVVSQDRSSVISAASYRSGRVCRGPEDPLGNVFWEKKKIVDIYPHDLNNARSKLRFRDHVSAVSLHGAVLKTRLV